MKKLKERQIGERFKYRKNIVEVISGKYNFTYCQVCQFKNQSLNYKKNSSGFLITICEYKHKCRGKNRTDNTNVYFKAVERLNTNYKKN